MKTGENMNEVLRADNKQRLQKVKEANEYFDCDYKGTVGQKRIYTFLY